jgi:transducin (beta)-like 1
VTLVFAGFTHSAFAVKSEARLDRSTHFRKHIPRGELVELLSKALLYIEVESHWNGSSLALNCKSPFTLLDPHICSLDPNVKAPVLKIPPEQPNETQTPRLNGVPAASPKRRASSQPEEIALKEKRLRLGADDRMDVDSNSTQR